MRTDRCSLSPPPHLACPIQREQRKHCTPKHLPSTAQRYALTKHNQVTKCVKWEVGGEGQFGSLIGTSLLPLTIAANCRMVPTARRVLTGFDPSRTLPPPSLSLSWPPPQPCGKQILAPALPASVPRALPHACREQALCSQPSPTGAIATQLADLGAGVGTLAGPRNSTAFSKAPRREADSQPISHSGKQAVRQAIGRASRQADRQTSRQAGR